jgi:MFS family permease
MDEGQDGMATAAISLEFFGRRVVGAAFVLAVFGWGLGFYGPPVFLHAVRETRGWPLALISAAVTTHFVIGALAVANLPALYRRFGLPSVTRAGVVSLAIGLLGWAMAAQPWQLFLATIFSGIGWVTMGAAAINAIVAPWFVHNRPKALSMAYNGASIGGVLFSPLWVALIAGLGFPLAMGCVGIAAIVLVWLLCDRFFATRPDDIGQQPDGDVPAAVRKTVQRENVAALPGTRLWRDWRFRTLALGMALSLFAQIGLIAHLFTLLLPLLDDIGAGLAMTMATAAAILGRTLFGWLMPAGTDRRLIACLSYAIQLAGSLLLVLADGQSAVLALTGIFLFGFGIGNSTSLPPLIAQTEFAAQDTGRVVALIVAIGQGAYAFAPAMFGLLREIAEQRGDSAVFIAAAIVQVAAIASMLAGRRR